MLGNYRRNAGIVVFNRQRRILLCKRNDIADAWQFPQGGIESGETVAQAALRELKEETSLTDVQLIKSLDKPARYTFPPQVIESMKRRGFTNIGQDIYWSLVFFGGDDAKINLQTAEAEFDEYSWETMEEACKRIVDFKKAAYEVARAEFDDIIRQYDFDCKVI